MRRDAHVKREPKDMRVHHLLVSEVVKDYVERYARKYGMMKTDAVEQLLMRALVDEGMWVFASDDSMEEGEVPFDELTIDQQLDIAFSGTTT